jgi:hypothetical protein
LTTRSRSRFETVDDLNVRESGTPFSDGSSHASALTSAICAGGETPRAARPRFLLETLQPLTAEPSSPVRHRLAGDIEPLSDLLTGHTISRVQDRLRAHHWPEYAAARRSNSERCSLVRTTV